MSSKEEAGASREDVKAAREAKKLAKQKAKNKGDAKVDSKPLKEVHQNKTKEDVLPKSKETKSKDEVDKAAVATADSDIPESDKSSDLIKAEKSVKKTANQARKGVINEKQVKKPPIKAEEIKKEMTVKDVVETLKDIKKVAKEVQDITAKVSAIHLEGKKEDDSSKSKADLKAERRAKQDAQRANKLAAAQEKAVKKEELKAKLSGDIKHKEEKSSKPKSVEKPKAKPSPHRAHLFEHLYQEQGKNVLDKIPINSNLHPAIVKLGVQLASGVVKGSNARCVALLDALKKMVRDYTLPAKTEFARGLESHLAASLAFLWSMRPPSASQDNAVKFFRYHLTQLPNNVDEFDAKKTLQEEIDVYIREQIDKAGEAISLAVRDKISPGDTILTYGCSSLIERILVEAWQADVRFRCVVVGDRVRPDAREMLRRLAARGLHCTYADITALSYVMRTVNKVILGAGALLANGSVLGAAGSAQVALVARAFTVPVLVACETHKFSERVHTDAFVHNEIGDPDDFIDKSDESSPLKDWRSTPNLTPLNLTYDVTPPGLVTAVVTELAILPCTSAPVVLRFKLSEYGI